MIKNLIIAAAVATGMCGSVRASGGVLEVLSGAAGGDINTSIPVPVAARAAGAAGNHMLAAGTYTNAEGCVVTVERRLKGDMVYIQDARGRQATVGVLNDLGGGDIYGFCSPASAAMSRSSIELSCGEQSEAGAYSTRGKAVLQLTGGLASVSVRGEVKKFGGWRTDTDLVCGGLKPAAGARSAAKSGFFMGVESCSVLDGIYPGGMTNGEAMDMLSDCFKDVSEAYKVPVTLGADAAGLNISVGRSQADPLGGNAAVTKALRVELQKRGNKLFDLHAGLTVVK